MKHIIAILPALIIALGLCGSAWIYAYATRYEPDYKISEQWRRPMAFDHWTGKVEFASP